MSGLFARVALTLTALLAQTSSIAAIVSGNNFPAKVAKSDTILVARVEDIGSGSTGQSYVSLATSRVIKGQFVSPVRIPIQAWGDMVPTPGKFIMVYLKKDADSALGLVNKDWPYSPVVGEGSKEDFDKQSTEERVASELFATLKAMGKSATLSGDARGDRIWLTQELSSLSPGKLWLRQLHDADATDAGKFVYLSGLMRTGDLSLLQPELQRLVAAPKTAELEAAQVGSVLIDVADQVDNKIAEEILKSPNAHLRFAGAYILNNKGDKQSLGAVARYGLRDTDPMVRYFSVCTLARVTGEQTIPTNVVFRSNEKEYLAHWTAWARSQGIKDN